MINCQSVQLFEWLVVQATTTTAGEPSQFWTGCEPVVNTLPKWSPQATAFSQLSFVFPDEGLDSKNGLSSMNQLFLNFVSSLKHQRLSAS